MRFPGTEIGLGLLVAATAAMTIPVSRWTTTLAPVSEASGAVVGTAELDSAGSGASIAKVSIRGDQPGAIRPWHVHHGQCGQDGAVLGSPKDYPPITVGPDGTGSATAALDVASPASGDYLVNVHASAADLGTIVACGDLHASGK
jgi:hypothetical protein